MKYTFFSDNISTVDDKTDFIQIMTQGLIYNLHKTLINNNLDGKLISEKIKSNTFLPFLIKNVGLQTTNAKDLNNLLTR